MFFDFVKICKGARGPLRGATVNMPIQGVWTFKTDPKRVIILDLRMLLTSIPPLKSTPFLAIRVRRLLKVYPFPRFLAILIPFSMYARKSRSREKTTLFTRMVYTLYLWQCPPPRKSLDKWHSLVALCVCSKQ